MALLEALLSSEVINFLMYDDPLVSSTSTAATPTFAASHDTSDTTLFLESHHLKAQLQEEEVLLEEEGKEEPKVVTRRRKTRDKVVAWNASGPHQGTRKKRKRRPRVCKNKEEAENQRMTHITVERNRRKLMNEHLAVLRSLMPESYVQRGDQASIVGGAVDFVKELEHLLQNLEAKKLQFPQRGRNPKSQNPNFNNDDDDHEYQVGKTPFSCFFMYPQISWSRAPNDALASTSLGTDHAIADIEVTLIETHANMRILSWRNPRNLSKLVSGFHALRLTILHLSLTTLDPMVLYSISAKVEEGCELSSVDDIAEAVHHMLTKIDEVK